MKVSRRRKTRSTGEPAPKDDAPLPQTQEFCQTLPPVGHHAPTEQGAPSRQDCATQTLPCKKLSRRKKLWKQMLGRLDRKHADRSRERQQKGDKEGSAGTSYTQKPKHPQVALLESQAAMNTSSTDAVAPGPSAPTNNPKTAPSAEAGKSNVVAAAHSRLRPNPRLQRKPVYYAGIKERLSEMTSEWEQQRRLYKWYPDEHSTGLHKPETPRFGNRNNVRKDVNEILNSVKNMSLGSPAAAPPRDKQYLASFRNADARKPPCFGGSVKKGGTGAYDDVTVHRKDKSKEFRTKNMQDSASTQAAVGFPQGDTDKTEHIIARISRSISDDTTVKSWATKCKETHKNHSVNCADVLENCPLTYIPHSSKDMIEGGRSETRSLNRRYIESLITQGSQERKAHLECQRQSSGASDHQCSAVLRHCLKRGIILLMSCLIFCLKFCLSAVYTMHCFAMKFLAGSTLFRYLDREFYSDDLTHYTDDIIRKIFDRKSGGIQRMCASKFRGFTSICRDLSSVFDHIEAKLTSGTLQERMMYGRLLSEMDVKTQRLLGKTSRRALWQNK